MSKFKVGDDVMCRQGRGVRDLLNEGGVYNITSVADDMVKVDGAWYYENRFELFASRDPWAEVVGGADEVQGLKRQLDRIQNLMNDRHKKYGPGNIAKHGDLGILVRMGDKFSRLENGQEDHNDETVRDTLDDIIGYGLIWLLWLDGSWPGSPHDPFASRDDAR